MEADREGVARVMLQLRICRAKGTEFQELVESVLALRYPDFERVEAHGNLGDGGNDGFDPSTGTYYQTYAPNDISEKVAVAVSKLRDDFARTVQKWDHIAPIRHYRFVVNDRFDGTPLPVHEAVSEIGRAHQLESARVYGSDDLLADVFKLRDAEIFQLVGFPPPAEAAAGIDYAQLRQVVRNVAAKFEHPPGPSIIAVPDFEEKADFNGLSQYWKKALLSADRLAGYVEEYLASQGAFARQELRDGISSLYLDEKRQLPDLGALDGHADALMAALYRALGPAESEAAANAMLAVLGYYFASCDIFEDPSKPETSGTRRATS